MGSHSGGFTPAFPHGLLPASGISAWNPTVNRVYYVRNVGGRGRLGGISHQSGNNVGNGIAGIYRGTGVGVASTPGALIVASASIAIALAGIWQTMTFAATDIGPDDFFAMIFSAVCAPQATVWPISITNGSTAGWRYTENAGSFALPANATPVLPAESQAPAMVGAAP